MILGLYSLYDGFLVPLLSSPNKGIILRLRFRQLFAVHSPGIGYPSSGKLHQVSQPSLSGGFIGLSAQLIVARIREEARKVSFILPCRGYHGGTIPTRCCQDFIGDVDVVTWSLLPIFLCFFGTFLKFFVIFFVRHDNDLMLVEMPTRVTNIAGITPATFKFVNY